MTCRLRPNYPRSCSRNASGTTWRSIARLSDVGITHWDARPTSTTPAISWSIIFDGIC